MNVLPDVLDESLGEWQPHVPSRVCTPNAASVVPLQA
jgi:hypothetical protein